MGRFPTKMPLMVASFFRIDGPAPIRATLLRSIAVTKWNRCESGET
jgi:hypothetical protein